MAAAPASLDCAERSRSGTLSPDRLSTRKRGSAVCCRLTSTRKQTFSSDEMGVEVEVGGTGSARGFIWPWVVQYQRHLLQCVRFYCRFPHLLPVCYLNFSFEYVVRALPSRGEGLNVVVIIINFLMSKDGSPDAIRARFACILNTVIGFPTVSGAPQWGFPIMGICFQGIGWTGSRVGAG